MNSDDPATPNTRNLGVYISVIARPRAMSTRTRVLDSSTPLLEHETPAHHHATRRARAVVACLVGAACLSLAGARTRGRAGDAVRLGSEMNAVDVNATTYAR